MVYSSFVYQTWACGPLHTKLHVGPIELCDPLFTVHFVATI